MDHYKARRSRRSACATPPHPPRPHGPPADPAPPVAFPASRLLTMSKRCAISLVIPCFNHGAFVGEAVDSVLHAERNDVELIVVDDGSTDDRTRTEIDGLCKQGIHVIRQANKGLAGARNAGIAASRGEYIFPLDADDRMRDGWIDGALAILDSDSKVGVVYGDAQCFGTRTDRW